MRYILVLLLVFWSAGAVGKPLIETISWGGVKFPNSLSVDDAKNVGFDTSLRTEIDHGLRFGNGRIISFVNQFSQADTEKYYYNGKQKIGIGFALIYPVKKYSKLSFEVLYQTDYRYLTTEFSDGILLSLNYGHYREWQKGEDVKLIFSVWANGKYPGSVWDVDRDNVIVQGQAKIARSARIGTSKYNWGPFAVLGVFGDKTGHEFNNKMQLDFGLSLTRKIAKVDMTLWAMYRYERRYESDDIYTAPMIGLSFFKRQDNREPKEKKSSRNWIEKLLKKSFKSALKI